MQRARTHDDSVRLQPLHELPALVVDGADADVRGWRVEGRDGHPLGYVSDLLADVDALTADHLIVAEDGDGASATKSESVMPVATLHALPEQRLLVSGGPGMTAIRLRYRSTTWLVWWALGVIFLILVPIVVGALTLGAWLW
jgi:hypothetical protein